ncbi:MAG: dephospho-CoA kinase [Planctomycetota bacterium]
MKIIGIAGGVASGKSVVSAKLQELGAFVIDADRIGHDVLKQPEVIAAATSRWGDSVTDDSGQLNRSAIGARVFGDTERHTADLRYWESETHPKITHELQRTLTSLRNSKEYPAAVLDAPVMFKAGWHKECDVIVFVDATREVRLQRAQKRGWTEEQFEDREACQTPLDEKRQYCEFVIDNSGDLEQTYEQVLTFWNSLSL